MTLRRVLKCRPLSRQARKMQPSSRTWKSGLWLGARSEEPARTRGQSGLALLLPCAELAPGSQPERPPSWEKFRPKGAKCLLWVKQDNLDSSYRSRTPEGGSPAWEARAAECSHWGARSGQWTGLTRHIPLRMGTEVLKKLLGPALLPPKVWEALASSQHPCSLLALRIEAATLRRARRMAKGRRTLRPCSGQSHGGRGAPSFGGPVRASPEERKVSVSL